ncbi:hypothetical protein GALMADRAFT_1139138 [Galerina marginata CBS 339.88]|uniref:Uncharacterized protein n=1 Tax=Galerina marginata (strain CBS 339.88) TaxID=685588 RepID=A0A067S7E1_GALM3|nr:hypothetical protein GALMADRAFT_1139138 [Galerina marginata CBS 339.88]
MFQSQHHHAVAFVTSQTLALPTITSYSAHLDMSGVSLLHPSENPLPTRRSSPPDKVPPPAKIMFDFEAWTLG